MLKLEPYVLKRYEEFLDRYFFYNVSSDLVWEADHDTGIVVSALDGSFSRESVIDILMDNSEISRDQLEEHFFKIFDYLIEKGFLSETGI